MGQWFWSGRRAVFFVCFSGGDLLLNHSVRRKNAFRSQQNSKSVSQCTKVINISSLLLTLIGSCVVVSCQLLFMLLSSTVIHYQPPPFFFLTNIVIFIVFLSKEESKKKHSSRTSSLSITIAMSSSHHPLMTSHHTSPHLQQATLIHWYCLCLYMDDVSPTHSRKKFVGS